MSALDFISHNKWAVFFIALFFINAAMVIFPGATNKDSDHGK